MYCTPETWTNKQHWFSGHFGFQFEFIDHKLPDSITCKKSPATMLNPPFGLALVGLTSGNCTGVTWSLRFKLFTYWCTYGYYGINRNTKCQFIQSIFPENVSSLIFSQTIFFSSFPMQLRLMHCLRAICVFLALNECKHLMVVSKNPTGTARARSRGIFVAKFIQIFAQIYYGISLFKQKPKKKQEIKWFSNSIILTIVYWFSTIHLFNTKLEATSMKRLNSLPSQ